MLNFEKIVTNHEILEIEKNAIKSGLKESMLIERAGQKISEFFHCLFFPVKCFKIFFILKKTIADLQP